MILFFKKDLASYYRNKRDSSDCGRYMSKLFPSAHGSTYKSTVLLNIVFNLYSVSYPLSKILYRVPYIISLPLLFLDNSFFLIWLIAEYDIQRAELKRIIKIFLLNRNCIYCYEFHHPILMFSKWKILCSHFIWPIWWNKDWWNYLKKPGAGRDDKINH